MATYRARKQQQEERKRLEARGYAQGPSFSDQRVVKKLQQATEDNLQRALQSLNKFYEHEGRPAPIVDHSSPLPPLEDIVKWVKFVVCTKQGRSTDIIHGETMLQTWRDLKMALHRRMFKSYTQAQVERITTVSVRTQPNRPILIKR